MRKHQTAQEHSYGKWPFIVDFPNKTSIYNGFSIAMLNYQRVSFQYFSVLLHVYSSRTFQYQFYGILYWNNTGIWDIWFQYNICHIPVLFQYNISHLQYSHFFLSDCCSIISHLISQYNIPFYPIYSPWYILWLKIRIIIIFSLIYKFPIYFQYISIIIFHFWLKIEISSCCRYVACLSGQIFGVGSFMALDFRGVSK